MNLFLTLPCGHIAHRSHMAKGDSTHKLHLVCQALLPGSSLWLGVNLLGSLAGCSMTCSPYLLFVCLPPSFLCSYPVQSVSFFFFLFFSIQWFCSSPILHGFSRLLCSLFLSPGFKLCRGDYLVKFNLSSSPRKEDNFF